MAACGGLWRGSRGPTRRLHHAGLESWRPGARVPGNLWQLMAPDWMPSNKPLLDAGCLSWGGPYDLSTQVLKPLIFIDLGMFWDLEACSLEAWARMPGNL